MRLSVRISPVEPGVYELPEKCPHPHCDGQHFEKHQDHCAKAIRDPKYEAVEAQRYRCLRCGRTFRVYPKGVSQAQQSDPLKAFSVLLYVLGLSYGGVSDVLEALQTLLGKTLFLSKTTVYRNVQASGQETRRLRRAWLQQGRRIRVIGADLTRVQCQGESLVVGVVVDDLQGIELSVDILDDETAETQLAWLRQIAEQVGAEVLVSDDADALKTVADELGLAHQICRGHVTGNVLDKVAELTTQALENPDLAPSQVPLNPERLVTDLATVQELIEGHPHDGEEQLAALYQRYCAAPAPREGEKATMWYRTRLLVLHLWNNWSRLTLYQRWQGPDGERLDGTNNSCERAIGWGVKERYRSMRGYKRQKSVLNVSSLLGWLGEQPAGYDLNQLVAA
jgi:transposase-like protein